MNALSYYRTNPLDLIDRLFWDDRSCGLETRLPAIDVFETKEGYKIEAELPGLNEKDIKLEVKDGVLVLEAAKSGKKEEKAEDGTWLRRERSELSFSRSFSLPEDVDAERIEARLRDGLLSVELPKKPESSPKTVTVKVA